MSASKHWITSFRIAAYKQKCFHSQMHVAEGELLFFGEISEGEAAFMSGEGFAKLVTRIAADR